jgi:hypothetical protein
MNKSLAAHYFKMSADQGNAFAQLNYGFFLANGDGISMNKSLAAHYYKLSADQGCAYAQEKYAINLLDGFGVEKDEKTGLEYLKRAADQGLVSAQYHMATLLRQGRVVEQNSTLSVYYLKLAADHGSIEGQIEYADWIIRDNGMLSTDQRRECERYLRMASDQGDSKGRMRLGIGLMCGLFGRFDFTEACQIFDMVLISRSESESELSLVRFAIALRNSLSKSDCELITGCDFSMSGSIFSFLRCSEDESNPLIRILNAHLNDEAQSGDQIFGTWYKIAHLSMAYIVDLSPMESFDSPDDERLPTDPLMCNSISEMIPFIFKMYSIECSLYKNVNHFMRCFPLVMVSKFMKELSGILHYIYLLESSIDYFSRIQPLTSDMIVYRGIRKNGRMLMPLYESMIDDVIVLPGFTSTSTDREVVIDNFIDDEDSLLFVISLHPGDVAVDIRNFSACETENEILIAASSGFTVENVELIPIRKESGSHVREFEIAQVQLSYFIAWSDFNIDDPPAPILV